jgi:hypothetical protein
MWHSAVAACEYGRVTSTEAADGGKVQKAEGADGRQFKFKDFNKFQNSKF